MKAPAKRDFFGSKLLWFSMDLIYNVRGWHKNKRSQQVIMDLISIVTLLGGLALFLYGMNEMSSSLMLASGSRLEVMLERMTSNQLKAIFLGAGTTAVIQSSSATTVMVVGLVNAGLLPLSQTVGLIMGANIGTTITAWILSLGSLGSTNSYFQLFSPSFFVPLIAIAAILIIMFTKNERRRNVSHILMGFAILMFGMQAMSGAIKPLSELPAFQQLFLAFSNPILGMLVGAILTAIIQSSSASIGILQAFALTGAVTYGSAIPIIMGQNIGTCVTALTSSINTSKNARRAALIHLFFNVIGTAVFMSAFYLIHLIRPFSFLNHSLNPVDIAIINTVYKLGATALFLPFRDWLVKFVIWITPDKRGKEESLPEEAAIFSSLDDRFLETPAFAVNQSLQMTRQMAEVVKDQFDKALDLLDDFHDQGFQDNMAMEELIDQYEDRLGTYMVRISIQQLSDKDQRLLTQLMQSLSDFERISDHALSIARSALEMSDKAVCFSQAAIEELAIYKEAVRRLVEITVQAFVRHDLELAFHVEPLEEVVDYLTDELQARHIKRLQDGHCTLQLGFIWMDVLTSMERIADHCSNIAVSMIELAHDSLDQHAFIKRFRQENIFKSMYEEYKSRYPLPDLPQSDYKEQLSLEEDLTKA